MSQPGRRALRLAGASAVAGTATLYAALGLVGAPSAAAQTDPTALVGEGGSFVSPVTNLLLNNDGGLAPLNPQYSDSDLDTAISDFVGSAPDEFDADFVVSERPLTSAETATATANGRTFAYVPFAATPVAIATFAVCNPSDLSENIVTASTFCRDIPLTPALVGELVTSGMTSAGVQPSSNLPSPLLAWNDTRLTQANGQGAIPDGGAVGLASTLSPSAENTALMSLLDSDPTAKELLDNALANPANSGSATTDTPDETWPFHPPHAYVGGDEGLLGKELTIIATTNAPGYVDSWGALGGIDGNAHDVFPVSAVWTEAPEGTPWDVPTGAIENADGQFVGPTESAAAEAEAGAGVTLDPATNLVTFNAEPTDATAYNNYLMVESYLVVPTSGLDPDKATKLAQFIRFILGPTGQSDLAVLGAAPATGAETTAGLKIASELDTEAITAAASGSSTTALPTGTSTLPGTTGQSEATAATGAADAADGGSGGTLALTGGSPLRLVVPAGAAVVVFGLGRWRLKRRVVSR